MTRVTLSLLALVSVLCAAPGRGQSPAWMFGPFEKPAPVLYPDKDAQARYEWTGGVEDPRIVESDDHIYVLTYTQWNRDIPRLAIATSKDLVHWIKHGPAFARAESGKYLRMETKSGAI